VTVEVLQSRNVVATAIAESLEKPYPWAVGFFFANLELSMELWTVIAGGVRVRRLSHFVFAG